MDNVSTEVAAVQAIVNANLALTAQMFGHSNTRKARKPYLLAAGQLVRETYAIFGFTQPQRREVFAMTTADRVNNWRQDAKRRRNATTHRSW